VLDPGLIHGTERWADQAALDRHFASPHIAHWRGTWSSLEIGERRLSVYEVGEPRTT
jgi:quinol monooxygenase YgiN